MQRSNNPLVVKLWWALNIALVVFVFLAFVFAAADFDEEKKVETSILNNIVTVRNSDYSLVRNYTVAKNHNIVKGSVVSFTDVAGEVGRGLGPIWDTPTENKDAFYPADHADVATYSDTGSFYVFSFEANPGVIYLKNINTPAQGDVSVGPKFTYNTTGVIGENVTILHIQVQALDNFTVAILFQAKANAVDTPYSAHVIAAQFSKDYSQVTWGATMPYQYSSAEIVPANILAARDPSGTVLQVAIGLTESQPSCSLQYFQLDTSASFLTRINSFPLNGFGFLCTFPLASLYLNGGYLVIANGQSVALAQITFTGQKSISPLATVSFDAHTYETLKLVNVPDQGVVVIVGIQNELALQAAKIQTQVFAWAKAKPYLTLSRPVMLFPNTLQLEAANHHLAAAYVNGDVWHPYGVLVFSFVDQRTGFASVVRGRLASYNGFYYVLGSARVSISNIPYYYTNRFGQNDTSFGPLLVSTGTKVTTILQSGRTTYNSFWWHGGYRIAGVAQADATAGKVVSVVRMGIANSEYPLLTGFSYYMNNSGDIHSSLSPGDAYTANGVPLRLGTALSESQLVLDYFVVDAMNNWF